MKMIPPTQVQHLLVRAAESLPSAHEASLWRFRNGVAQMCAGLLVLLLGPWGVQRVADCEAPHATVLRSGWRFQTFPLDGGFVLVCTPVQASDRTPLAFLVPHGIMHDPASASRALQDLLGHGLPVGGSGGWS